MLIPMCCIRQVVWQAALLLTLLPMHSLVLACVQAEQEDNTLIRSKGAFHHGPEGSPIRLANLNSNTILMMRPTSPTHPTWKGLKGFLPVQGTFRPRAWTSRPRRCRHGLMITLASDKVRRRL